MKCSGVYATRRRSCWNILRTFLLHSTHIDVRTQNKHIHFCSFIFMILCSFAHTNSVFCMPTVTSVPSTFSFFRFRFVTKGNLNLAKMEKQKTALFLIEFQTTKDCDPRPLWVAAAAATTTLMSLVAFRRSKDKSTRFRFHAWTKKWWHHLDVCFRFAILRMDG